MHPFAEHRTRAEVTQRVRQGDVFGAGPPAGPVQSFQAGVELARPVKSVASAAARARRRRSQLGIVATGSPNCAAIGVWPLPGVGSGQRGAEHVDGVSSPERRRLRRHDVRCSVGHVVAAVGRRHGAETPPPLHHAHVVLTEGASGRFAAVTAGKGSHPAHDRPAGPPRRDITWDNVTGGVVYP